MDRKIVKLLYYLTTIAFCFIMAFSASMYLSKYEMVQAFFRDFGYPTYLIYPLALAKFLGIIAVATRKSAFLKEWAYAGFFFNSLLATIAHFIKQDGLMTTATAALLLVILSRIFEWKTFSQPPS